MFLERDRQTRLERLSAAETLEGLMVGRFGPGRAARDFECLSRLASRTPGYRLTIRRFPTALTQLGRAFLGTELPAELSGSGAAA